MSEYNKSEMIELYYSFVDMFGFLARIYREEVDEKLVENIKGMKSKLNNVEDGISEGLMMMIKYSEGAETDMTLSLAVEYTKVFMGWGPKQTKAAFPYESVYTSKRGLLMQEARDEVVSLYAEEGLDKDYSYKEAEDHIAFELAYIQHLCSKSAIALANDKDDEINSYISKQRKFTDQHLLNWIPDFCDDITKNADSDFYIGLAKVTKNLLSFFDEILAEFEKERKALVFSSGSKQEVFHE
jgi:TorA maturation chaperone TorD